MESAALESIVFLSTPRLSFLNGSFQLFDRCFRNRGKTHQEASIIGNFAMLPKSMDSEAGDSNFLTDDSNLFDIVLARNPLQDMGRASPDGF